MSQPPEDSGDTSTSPAPEVRFTVASVARRLGIAPATLRTWDRRYGLGPSDHTFGAHRRYTVRDLDRLMVMRRLVLDGVPPGQAAILATSGAGDPGGGIVAGTDALVPSSAGRGVESPLHSTFDLVKGSPAQRVLAPPADRSTADSGTGGGRMLAMPGASAEVRGLAHAAMTLDGPAIAATVRAALKARGLSAAWHELLVPVLTSIGDRWAATGQGVDVEHLLSEATLACLHELPVDTAGQRDPRIVLCCSTGEYHSLPVHVLSVALGQRGIAARMLGGAVPPDALAAAVRRTRPAVLFCWSSMRSTGDVRYLDAVPALSPPVATVVGGPGWDLANLPRRVDVAHDVPGAVALIAARLGH